jgi:hypothetical protein
MRHRAVSGHNEYVRAPRWLVLAAVVLGLAACTGVPEPAPSDQSPSTVPATSASAPPATVSVAPTTTPISGTTPTTGLVGTVTIIKSGGMAGVQQILTVSADGSWMFVDKRKATTVRGTLSAADRQRLAALLRDPGLREEARPSAVCNDGFRYSVESTGVSMRFDQCNLGPKTRDLLAVLGSTPIN